MNDKEKLISFINKGKENKPVKEVHVIKDSPTEAHILLVNEDGTNVASNRFEIMDAHDLMTLIENPTDSGLIIDISEDNKKVSFKIDNDEFDYNFYNENEFNFTQEEQTRFSTLYNFLIMFQNLEDSDIVIRNKFTEYDLIKEPGLYKITFGTFLDMINYMSIHGKYENNVYFAIAGSREETNNFIKLYYIDDTDNIKTNLYNEIDREYTLYKQASGKEIYLSVWPIY